ncbi:MAG TPA: transglutaminase-like domain-containing protein [Longimicrobiales bacterium]|nr:transglutaminase-like domain-containing protein [Longimicrobiales bacterium]
MPPLRRILGGAILVLWLVVVGWHVRREYFRPQAELMAAGARGLGPGSYFYTIKMNGSAIGLASSRLDTLPDGFVFEDLMTLDVPALDAFHRATVRTRMELGRSLATRSFAFELRSEVGSFEVTGSPEGDSLVLQVRAGDTAPTRIAVRADAVMGAALPLRLAASGRLRVGEELEASIFDPSVLEHRSVRLRVLAHDTILVPDSAHYDFRSRRWETVTFDTVPAWRVEEAFGGVAVDTWLDGDGRVIRAESPLGFAMERTAYEHARADWERARGQPRLASGYGAIIESTAIASDVPLERGQGEDSLAVRLVGVELAGFDLAGGRQRLSGDTLRIRREDLRSLEPGYALPWSGGGEPAAELAATPLIQSGDPRIIDQARRIAGGSTDPAVVARRLSEWVYAELDKVITLSVPSALQVLEARQGDCNEHTVLYVALARALGLPARTAVGLVHLRGRFYYHAWPEVWLDGRWVAVDPTLGQVPADAGHLRFVVGGLARQVELIRLIGRLRLEVV